MISFCCFFWGYIKHWRLFNVKSSLYIYIQYTWFCFVLWHINHRRLFNGKSSSYIYVKYIGFGWIGFYGISTITGYLEPNSLYIYIYIYIYIDIHRQICFVLSELISVTRHTCFPWLGWKPGWLKRQSEILPFSHEEPAAAK